MLAFTQITRIENQIQSLIPRYITQRQRNFTLNCITGYDIHTRLFCQNLQYSTYIYILEVKGNTLTFIGFSSFSTNLSGSNITHRSNLHHVTAI